MDRVDREITMVEQQISKLRKKQVYTQIRRQIDSTAAVFLCCIQAATAVNRYSQASVFTLSYLS